MKNKLIILMVGLVLACSLINAYTDSVYIEDYDLSASYDSAIVDNVLSLTLTITNDASSTKNLEIEFDEKNPFEFLSDEYWEINLLPGENASKTFRIKVDKDAESKKYDLKFNLDDGEDDWDDKFEIQVSSDSAEISIGDIISSPKKITPDSKEVQFDVTIKNKGDKDAEDLIATLILPEEFNPSSSYSNIVHIGDLNKGDSETLTFYFDTDKQLTEENYKAQIKLDYECEGDDETSYLDIDIPVFPIPQFKITKTESLQGDITSGSKEKIKIGIQNIGGEDAEDVTLKVYERSDQPFTFDEKSVYIGSLKVGETGYAVFSFDVDSGTDSNEYLLDIQARSVSGDSVIVQDLTTKIQIIKKEITKMQYIFYIGLGLTLVLGSFIFLFIRRR